MCICLQNFEIWRKKYHVFPSKRRAKNRLSGDNDACESVDGTMTTDAGNQLPQRRTC